MRLGIKRPAPPVRDDRQERREPTPRQVHAALTPRRITRLVLRVVRR